MILRGFHRGLNSDGSLSKSSFLSFALLARLLLICEMASAVDPTSGFITLPPNRSNLAIQKPFDVPEDQRYSYKDGVHKLCVFSTDKPHTPYSQTKPRTEIRIRGYDYSSGVWQFEGYGYVPCGTTGVCIMQVFGASSHATTLMLRVYDGSLYYYREKLLVPSICDRWFRLNAVHDVGASSVKVYVDGELKLEAPGRGGAARPTTSSAGCMRRRTTTRTTRSLDGRGSRSSGRNGTKRPQTHRERPSGSDSL